MRALIVSCMGALVLTAGAGSAPATYPGKNGLIAYTKKGPPCIARQCAESLWVSALDGSNARRLTSVSRKDHQRRHATWSPDGTTIAYLDDTGPRRFGSSPQEIWIVKANGTGKKKVASSRLYQSYNQRPSWTADGKELAFILAESGSVLAIDVQTKKVRELLRLPRYTTAMQLSPNGKLVAYTTQQASGSVFVRPVRGGKTTKIAGVYPGPFNDSFAWSPDSTRLVVLTPEHPYVPAIVSATGGPVRRIAVDSEPNEQWHQYERPIWSPDGRTILWQVLSHSEPDPTSPPRSRSVYDWDRFRTIDVDSGKVTVVGPGTGSCRLPAGGSEDTGGRRGPDPCPVSDPSWQPRK